MIHISEISWGRVRHPLDFLQPGEMVQVMIINIDPEQQRVGLSLKRLTENPWDDVKHYLSQGDELTGAIAGVERFGVFVELHDGLEGLLHISELCKRNRDASATLYQDYQVGASIKVRVLEIIPKEHRIALGLPHKDDRYATAA